MKCYRKITILISTLLVFILLSGFETAHSLVERNLEDTISVTSSSILYDKQDVYNLVNSSIHENDSTLFLSFEAQKKIYYTQILKGKHNLLKNHIQIEKTGKWNLIPDVTSINQEKNYIIAISEVYIDDEVYTVIVQTYDNEFDKFGDSYSKEEILDFTNSLNIEYTIKNLL